MRKAALALALFAAATAVSMALASVAFGRALAAGAVQRRFASLTPGFGTAALLFGVNAWCLDGRGMVWRETLPVVPERVFDARTLVVGECLLAVSGITLVMALVRNGLPPLLLPGYPPP